MAALAEDEAMNIGAWVAIKRKVTWDKEEGNLAGQICSRDSTVSRMLAFMVESRPQTKKETRKSRTPFRGEALSPIK